MAARVCSVISNRTGRPVFFWITVATVSGTTELVNCLTVVVHATGSASELRHHRQKQRFQRRVVGGVAAAGLDDLA
jgi:hypothetical protein